MRAVPTNGRFVRFQVTVSIVEHTVFQDLFFLYLRDSPIDRKLGGVARGAILWVTLDTSQGRLRNGRLELIQKADGNDRIYIKSEAPLTTQIRAAFARGLEPYGDDLFHRLTAAYPESPWTAVLRGERAFKAGQWTRAVADLTKGLDALSTESGLSVKDLLPYLLLRARAYGNLERFAEANRDIETILKVSPRDPDVLWTWSIFLEKQGNYGEAQKAIREAIRAAEWKDPAFLFSPKEKEWKDRFFELSGRAKQASHSVPVE